MSISRQQAWTALFVILTLGAGHAVKKRLPDPGEIRQRPFSHTATLGQAANLRTGQLTVTGLNAAPSVISEASSLVATAPPKVGIFLVLDLVYVARDRPGTLASIAVISPDGRRFGGRAPVGNSACGVAQPGIPLSCRIVVELARDALQGAKLEVAADPVSEGMGDDIAVVDLQIDGTLARALMARTGRLPVGPNTPSGAQR